MSDFDPLNPPEPNKERDEIHRHTRSLFKKVFMTPEGRELLELIQQRTVRRPVEPQWEPSTPDEQYQWMKRREFRRGQNDIVNQITREVFAEVEDTNNDHPTASGSE
jgi:hypothetical protein